MRGRNVATLFVGGCLLASVASACVSEPHRRTPPGKVFGGGVCAATPGQLPAPDCDDSARSCAASKACVIDESRCGSTSTCLPTSNNAGKSTLDFRIRRLNLAAPAALASPFIQNTVVNGGIDLAEPACGESGKGLFTWLLRIDPAAGTLVTGGAPPTRDPLGQGFCFAELVLDGTRIEPKTTTIETDETGSYRTRAPLSVNIPIFLSDALSSAIILPIQDARIEGLSVSSDGRGPNCIGTFNAAALDSSCTEDRTLCSKWTTAGALAGFITLEDADRVKIVDLADKSLCAFLAGEPTLKCARDPLGKIAYAGDYCAVTKTPGGCADSVWLAATFAASAAQIFDGRGVVPGCSGVTAGGADAGTDASP